jgi:transcriptional regulator with XRE-family HTH domain
MRLDPVSGGLLQEQHMGYDWLRATLRAARRDRELTQAALAASSGTSRVTIARLEAGSLRDVRLGTVAALCRALGLELAAAPPGAGPALEKLLAREGERSRRLDLRRRHAVLAARLLAQPRPKAARLVARAQGVVDRWERDRLCSHHYVTRWRRMLGGTVEQVARSLLDPGDWGDALFQNTPWSFALEPAAA